jgi:hypothetical protein
MTRHLSFVAALGMCFFASITTTHAQVRADTGASLSAPVSQAPLLSSASHKKGVQSRHPEVRQSRDHLAELHRLQAR